MSKWHYIPGLEGYQVTATGNIRNSNTGRELKLMTNDGGHLYFLPHRGIKYFAHRAVLEAFVGQRPQGMQCRHLNGNPKDNRLENLCWGTAQENSDDRRLHGTLPVGERSGTHKLTEVDVLEIRKLYMKISLRKLAAHYGVSHTAIRRAAIGIKWGYLNG